MIKELKKYFIYAVLLMIISINVACNNSQNKKEEISAENEKMNQIINVDDFMEYYNISEGEVPRDYVGNYICHYRLCYEDMQKDQKNLWGNKVISAYKAGDDLDKYLGSMFHGPESELSLEDYMDNADIIAFEFNMVRGQESNKMLIDLKNEKIYFTRKSSEEYKEFEMQANLTDDDVKRIREELPKHIVEGKGYGTYGISQEYYFRIHLRADDYSTKFYNNDYGDEEHFPGFDDYWKSLYREYFGEEYRYLNPLW